MVDLIDVNAGDVVSIYRRLDLKIDKYFFSVNRPIENWKGSIKTPKTLFELVLGEKDLLNKSLEDVVDWNQRKYYDYLEGWYLTPSKKLHLLEPTGTLRNSTANLKYSITELFEKAFLEVSRQYKFIEKPAVMFDPTTVARYDGKTKSIFINPQLKSTTRLYYTFIHELLHHVQSYFCSLPPFYYKSSYEEGLTILMTERLIKGNSLFIEHKKYVDYTRNRGYYSYLVSKGEISEKDFVKHVGEFTQYVSTLRYPGYKEGYYIWYDILRNSEKDISELLDNLCNPTYIEKLAKS